MDDLLHNFEPKQLQVQIVDQTARFGHRGYQLLRMCKSGCIQRRTTYNRQEISEVEGRSEEIQEQNVAGRSDRSTDLIGVQKTGNIYEVAWKEHLYCVRL